MDRRSRPSDSAWCFSVKDGFRSRHLVVRALHVLVAVVAVGVLVACTGGRSAGAGDGPVASQQRGTASYYADKFVGRQTANGETYRHDKMTAAHRSLPFGTEVRVTRVDTGESIVVRINDRGPFKAGRIIDLSKRAARELGIVQAGLAEVTVRPVGAGPAPDESSGEGRTSTSW